jgi:hypothetical protein
MHQGELEHVKSAVLVSFGSPVSQRSYCRSNKTVVTRYRIHLEDKLLAPGKPSM